MKYTGSCHCQRVKFVCEFDLKQPIVCNCSYCSKRNAILHIVDDIKVYKGETELACYKFNKMKGAHHFCKHCGIFIYGPTPSLKQHTINLSILDNCNWEHLSLYHFDGRSL